ncbi:hypothetical protein NU10_05905 [Flavobacterium dauae]|uniref:hypothetical protein n=1 Tax=Flavobacterium dauae TaxID=1563479 RepID=UPI00101B279E|nr:hypothetical protein [Flavobacterium dauae]WLD24913.1 hypothetical protein NU10_05905 [Flavobacterium dauae]
MKLNTLILCILFFSCITKPTNNESKSFNITDTITTKIVINDTTNINTEIIEIFVDSLNIGEKGKNKIKLIKHRVFNNDYIIVKFYNKAPNRWYLQNTYIYECDALMGLAPNISDFNNDNFNDITFISAQAARSANEVRRLFIYDNYQKELVSIVNSESYPNMLYNKELNCIDAFLVHGGSSTVFARIKGDSLKEFASVHNDSHRTVYEIDLSGREKLLRKDKINPEDVYIRYINYKPLKEYRE